MRLEEATGAGVRALSSAMMSFCRTAAALALLIGGAAVAIAADDVQAPPQVRLETIDGEFAGSLDARTDEQAAWIREEEAGIVLATAVAWGDVVAAQLNGDPIETAVLLAKRDELATEATDPLLAERAVPQVVTVDSLGAAIVCTSEVRSLEILDVALVNLDRDVEPDGLEVAIAPIAIGGLPRAVRGNLTLELIGERRPRDTANDRVATLDRWSQRVRETDFVNGVATYQLWFRDFAPEWDFAVPPDAILTANLGAHGQGNYSASAPIVVRQFSPMRDNLQLFHGSRFASPELTGGKPYSRFGVEQGRWHYWPR